MFPAWTVQTDPWRRRDRSMGSWDWNGFLLKDCPFTYGPPNRAFPLNLVPFLGLLGSVAWLWLQEPLT